MTDQNLPNGLQPHLDYPKERISSLDRPPHQQINGLHSAHSSRSASPSVRLVQIPSSQLPPARPAPQSQLPPSRSPLTTITQKMGELSTNQTVTSYPNRHFTTSTPTSATSASFSVKKSAFSPISPTLPMQQQSKQPEQIKNGPVTQTAGNIVPNVAGFGQQVSNVNYQYLKTSSSQPPMEGLMKMNSLKSMPVVSPQQNFQQNSYSGLPQSALPYQTQQTFQRPPVLNSQFPQMQPLNPQFAPQRQPGLQNNGLPASTVPNFINNAAPPRPAQPLNPAFGGASPAARTNNLHSNRYPAANAAPVAPQTVSGHPQGFQQEVPYTPVQNQYLQQSQQPQQAYQGVAGTGFNKYWGTETYDLLQNPNILPPSKLETPRINLGHESLDQANCHPDIFRCTLTKIPENNNLLQKSRLPLGVLIHPFKDLAHLPVIQCTVIVRCRACRTYINPFVSFVDSKRWKCNLCYRINELPEEFQYDPVTKTYGDPSRRPEIKSSTIEYIAPAEYMLRPPQPAVYLFLLDVSRLAVESGYLSSVSLVLTEELKTLPGDARTQVGFIAYDSAVRFYSLAEGLSQPHEMTVLDIDDIFLPTPDNLLVNLKDRMELVAELLQQIPARYANTMDSNSALGAALQAAYKMMSATGGRVTVFQASLPNVGPGALTSREDPSHRSSAEVAHLNPANDFYKRLALECSGQQVCVDLFLVNSQYVDLATISGISRFSGGCVHHFPLFKTSKPPLRDGFERCFRRYLTRKIGFEAVMRVRCTRGLSIHTFHGNFFVRSTDLLSLPNVNPDAGFGMQVAIEESLTDLQTVSFQAALLYTSSKGERRIRVHTLCVPLASTLHDVIHSADQQCIVGLLAKMAVDRSMQASLTDAREAFINAAIDILSSYKMSLNMATSSSGLLAPNCLKLLPLYISALLKHPTFKIGGATRLDDRLKAMIDMKTMPLGQLIKQVYPDLYPVHSLDHQEVILNSEEEPVPMPPRLQLSARCLDNKGVFLMDLGEKMVIYVCPGAPQELLSKALGVASYNSIPDQMYELPIVENATNERLHQFINYLNEDKPYAATVQVIRDSSPERVTFLERLIEDRVENALSYHEFLQHLKTQVK